jgi:hypothetical protein
MSELDFFMGKWEPFSDTGAVLTCKMKKKGGKRTRQANVIIWQVLNADWTEPQLIGKFFIIGPERNKSIFDWVRDGPRFDTLKDAKPHAKKLLHDYISRIMHGEINWWTKKEIFKQ